MLQLTVGSPGCHLPKAHPGPVATAPTLTVSGQTSNINLNVLRTTWETVGNPDTNATQLSQPTLEGWAAVGTPGFTVAVQKICR
jgi:hypothetical protein